MTFPALYVSAGEQNRVLMPTLNSPCSQHGEPCHGLLGRQRPRVTVENLDAVVCLERYDRPTTFFYIDPPYWETAGYAVPFGEADFRRLRAALDRLKGRFLLSMNDVPATRALFDGFRLRGVSTSYSLDNARQGAGRGAVRRELLVSNYDLPKRV